MCRDVCESVILHQAVEGGFEINGCCFQHTALTEQYITHLVGELLLESGLVVGNRPVGVWKYTIPNDPTTFVEKFCGLFETLGERRVGSHLVPGLECLVPLLFPNITEEEVCVCVTLSIITTHMPACLDQVTGFFPKDRLLPFSADQQGSKVKPTWSACCSGLERVRL